MEKAEQGLNKADGSKGGGVTVPTPRSFSGFSSQMPSMLSSFNLLPLFNIFVKKFVGEASLYG